VLRLTPETCIVGFATDDEEDTMAATTPARNYRCNAHTARFLMAFHAGAGSIDAPQTDTYEVPEHNGGGSGLVEINRGRVEEVDVPAEGFGDSPMTREARCLECGGFHRGGASCAPRDARSEGQIRYMDNLITWIAEKDAVAGQAARTWTDNVTAAGKWSHDKTDKFSISAWIDRLKAKNADLNKVVKAHPRTEAGPVEVTTVGTLPVKLDKNGKAMALRYAVDIEGTTKFYKIKPGNKPGFYFIDAQASDEFHPVRNRGTKDAIIKAILAAGADDCMARYGQLIGSCGRCGRTLTDADSRAIGIGPDCLGKM
jgi:hypothetical protein